MAFSFRFLSFDEVGAMQSTRVGELGEAPEDGTVGRGGFGLPVTLQDFEMRGGVPHDRSDWGFAEGVVVGHVDM
jgi:hypothetical protein